MGYRYPGNETQAAIELYPVTGKPAIGRGKARWTRPGRHTGIHRLGGKQAGSRLQHCQNALGCWNQSSLCLRTSGWKEILGCDRLRKRRRRQEGASDHHKKGKENGKNGKNNKNNKNNKGKKK